MIVKGPHPLPSSIDLHIKEGPSHQHQRKFGGNLFPQSQRGTNYRLSTMVYLWDQLLSRKGLNWNMAYPYFQPKSFVIYRKCFRNEQIFCYFFRVCRSAKVCREDLRGYVEDQSPSHQLIVTALVCHMLFGPALPTGGSYVTSSVCLSVRLSATQDLILPTIRFFWFFAWS